MRPSRLFVWLALAALLLALIAVTAPGLDPRWALIPFALLVAVWAVDWAISSGPRSFEVEAKAEREVFTGETVHLDVRIVPTKANIKFPASGIAGSLAPVDGLTLTAEPDMKDGVLGFELRATRRGVWTVDRVWLRWRSRLGLTDFVPVRPINLSINVVPNIRMITSGQIDLEMQTSEFGAKQTTMRGEGSEFHQLTDYVQGMDPRSIDWKHSARHHALVSKEMRAERNHQIIMAMDNGHLMREEIDGLAKIDHKINAALALSWAGVQGGDQVGLFAFDARPRLFLPPSPGRVAFAQMRSRMAELEYKSVETNHTLALSNLHQRLSKRSLVVVFSDFVDALTAQLLVEHVAILNRHHVVIFVSLRDPLLRNLMDQPSQSMVDIARSVSAGTLLNERRTVLDSMAAMGVHVIEADPGNVTPRLVNTYLAIKAREMI